MVERYTEWADWTGWADEPGGHETTSGDWDGLGGRERQPFAKVRVAGSNPVVRAISRRQVTKYPVQADIT
jgi:hypothetical protein